MCVKEFKEDSSPIPPELILRIKDIRNKAEDNKRQEVSSDLFMLSCYLDRAMSLMEDMEQKGFKMRTIKQNLEFLIDGLGEWRENNDI